MPYRPGRGGGGDPLALRAARLNAYRAALLRSIRAEEELESQPSGGRLSSRGRPVPLRPSGGGGGGGRGRPPAQRDGGLDGDRYVRRPVQYSRSNRGHRLDDVQSRDTDEDDEYY